MSKSEVIFTIFPEVFSQTTKRIFNFHYFFAQFSLSFAQYYALISLIVLLISELNSKPLSPLNKLTGNINLFAIQLEN